MLDNAEYRSDQGLIAQKYPLFFKLTCAGIYVTQFFEWKNE